MRWSTVREMDSANEGSWSPLSKTPPAHTLFSVDVNRSASIYATASVALRTFYQNKHGSDP